MTNTDHGKRIGELRTRVQKRRATESPASANPFDGLTDKTLYALRDQLAHSTDDGADEAQRRIVEELRRRRRASIIPAHSGD